MLASAQGSINSGVRRTSASRSAAGVLSGVRHLCCVLVSYHDTQTFETKDNLQGTLVESNARRPEDSLNLEV